MNNNQDNLSGLDILTVFSVILQVMGYQQDKQQVSNDILLKELQKQNSEYLEKIIRNEKEILETLSDLKSEFADNG